MKQLLVILVMIMASATSVEAQKVFQEIQKLSSESLRNRNKSEFERGIALFRIDALEYMSVMTAEQMSDSTSVCLDKQAYGMYEFTYIFYNLVEEMTSRSSIENLKRIFKIVTLDNPRFNDNEPEAALKFIRNKNNMTPFSLNTDWVKAVAIIKEKGYYYE